MIQKLKFEFKITKVDLLLRSEIRSLFFGSLDTYGHRNIKFELTKQDIHVTYREALRIMKEEGLKVLPFVKRSNLYG